MTEYLSIEGLDNLWKNDFDNTLRDEDILTLYWRHRLRHASLTTLHRLSRRGTVPKSIQKMKRMPLCTECTFATAHRKPWRTKAKENRSI